MTRDQVGRAARALSDGDSNVQGSSAQLYAATDYWDVGVLSGIQEITTQVVSGQLAFDEAFDRLADALRWHRVG